jgi:sec-independent protein translocase protein TatC
VSTDPEKLAEGTLISHLLELRSRLIRALAAVGICFVPCAYYSNQIFTFIAKPLLDKLPKGGALIATGVMTPFTTPFKLSFFVAIFFAMPYVLYQLWAFVGPGLYRQEKRFAVPLMVSSVILFYAGVIFAYVVVFPMVFAFFTSTTPQGVAMFLAFGIAFEVPVAVVLLVLTGLVRVDRLKANRGYVLIAIFIVAAILTPPDALSQCIMALPMYLLYESGVLMAQVMQRMQRAERERDTAKI